MSIGHSTTATGSPLLGAGDWNAAHAVDTSGVDIPGTTAPAAPAAGKVRIFGRNIANVPMLASMDSNGLIKTAQAHFGRNKVGMWSPGGNNGNAVTAIGIATPTSQGTGATRNVATTNLLAQTRRAGVASAATAGSYTGFRASAFQFFRGNAAGMGGFLFMCRWGCSDAATVAGARSFVGLAAASITAVNPSSQTNIIGVGTDDTDANLQIIYNDGSGTATKIDLGANFPDHTLSADLYELAIYCAPNSTTIGVQVTRLNTGDTFTTTLSTDLPAVNTLLGPQVMRNNGATALAVGIDLVGLYIETDT